MHVATRDSRSRHSSTGEQSSSQRHSPTPGSCAGVPTQYQAAIVPRYDPFLLQGTLSMPVFRSLCSDSNSEPQLDVTSNTYITLLLLNRQTHDELKTHGNVVQVQPTDLFIFFPHGIRALQISAPHLLRQARNVHIVGVYNAHGGHFGRAPRSADLTALMTTLLSRGSPIGRPAEMITLRILYHNTRSLSEALSTETSPIVIAMCNSGISELDLTVWPGRETLGVQLCIRPSEESKREFSRYERNIEDQPCERWLVGG